MVTVVAGKLRAGGYVIANCIRQPERKLPRPAQIITSSKKVTPACIKEHAIITLPCRYSKPT